jgi:hypothetical protein
MADSPFVTTCKIAPVFSKIEHTPKGDAFEVWNLPDFTPLLPQGKGNWQLLAQSSSTLDDKIVIFYTWGRAMELG